jgi:6,7-dimethyl-8-ribityllumazine synthase
MAPSGAGAAAGRRFAIVVSRFNEAVTRGLLAGAQDALAEAGVPATGVTIVWVPGAFEIPVTALRLARSGEFAAVICLGCLIKGETLHFEYLAAAASTGIMEASLVAGVPMTFGVLTVLTDEQAEERARPGPGNKGHEAALAAVEMAALFARVDAERRS